MSSDTRLPDESPKTPVVVRFFTHIFDMPMWQKLILVLAGVFGVAGLTGKISEKASANNPAPEQQVDGTSQSNRTGSGSVNPGASRGFVSQNDSGTPKETTSAPPDATADGDKGEVQKILVEHGPWMRRIGLTFLACFIIGWLFRMFVRMMAMLATVIAILFFGLSYFGVTNVDLTPVKQKYDTAMQWVSAQGEKAKDALMKQIPASASSVAGFAFGFKKNRR